MLGSQSLLYELLARQKESGISAVCPEYSEVGMMKTQFFQAQDLSENMQLLVKLDTGLLFQWTSNSHPPAPTLARWIARLSTDIQRNNSHMTEVNSLHWILPMGIL